MIEAAREPADRGRAAIVLEQLDRRQIELADLVIPVQRLAGIVEDPQDVVRRIVEKEHQRLEPLALEVLALVDHDRVETLGRQRIDGPRERRREGLVPPLGRGVDRPWWQDAGALAERLAQPVERRDRQALGRRRVAGGHLLDVAQHRRRQRLVEADEQRPEPLAGQPSRLLEGEDRLAAAGGPDDLDPAQVAEVIERPRLLARGPDQPGPIVLDIVAEEPSEADGRRQVVVDPAHALGAERRAATPVADPVGVRAIDRSAGRLRRGQGVRVEDEVGRCVRPEERVVSWQAGEVDVGKRDGVADPWLLVRRPVGQVVQDAAEVVLGRLGLGEGGAIELPRAKVPAAVGGSTWLARLDLDDEQPKVRVHDDEVRLPIVRRPRAPRPGAPADVLVDPVLGWEGRPEGVVDVPLGGLPARLGDLVDQRSPIPCAHSVRHERRPARRAAPRLVGRAQASAIRMS